jgi:hypothetical protein
MMNGSLQIMVGMRIFDLIRQVRTMS